MPLIRLLIKTPFILLLIVIGLILALTVVPFGNRSTALKIARVWHKSLLVILNVHLNVAGKLSLDHGLMASNHISWLDIIVLGSHFQTVFVSKAEVKSWPVIGWLASAAGTVFLTRGKGQSEAIRSDMQRIIKDKTFVLFFPEGTTSDGSQVLKFHPRLFGAAIDSHQPVQPVAIHYLHDSPVHPYVPFLGEQTLAANLFNLVIGPRVDVNIHIGEAITSKALDRKTLAETAHSSVSEMLN